ncbi:hypothetical protein [Vibrio alginolyticus]|uniref:hypothetical protein n=1 Tax=Vibrio alginolyticus TaxID=663 RepID=UPI0015F36F44|nr:hypothetical protein [Vibrio alginolyticus]
MNRLYKQMMGNLLSSVDITEEMANHALVTTTKTSLEHRLTDNIFRFWFVGIRSLNEIHSRQAEAITKDNHIDCLAYSALLTTAAQVPLSISIVSELASSQMTLKLADGLIHGGHGWWNPSVCSIQQLIDMRNASFIQRNNIDVLNFTAMIAARKSVESSHLAIQ